MEKAHDLTPDAAGGPIPKPWIQEIHGYIPGKSKADDGRELVKLSANENPLGCGSKAREAIALTAASDMALYPDPDSTMLRAAIAVAHGLKPDRVICGTGSGELLNIAAQAFAGPGDEIIHMRYGFSLYEIVTRKVGANPVIVDDMDFGTDVDAVLAAVTESTRLVLIANPNNPTGSWSGKSEIARLHAGLRPDILLVLDQAYAEYVEDEDDGGLDLARTAPNVLVTRTFSKAYGLASERIGWATGSETMIEVMNRLRGAFNTTAIGQAAAIAALSDTMHLERSRNTNTAGLARLSEALSKYGNQGVRVLPSKANFALVLFEGDVTAVQAQNALIKAGYVARHLPGQGLPHGLRITIGTPDQMDDVIGAIATLFEGQG